MVPFAKVRALVRAMSSACCEMAFGRRVWASITILIASVAYPALATEVAEA